MHFVPLTVGLIPMAFLFCYLLCEAPAKLLWLLKGKPSQHWLVEAEVIIELSARFLSQPALIGQRGHGALDSWLLPCISDFASAAQQYLQYLVPSSSPPSSTNTSTTMRSVSSSSSLEFPSSTLATSSVPSTAPFPIPPHMTVRQADSATTQHPPQEGSNQHKWIMERLSLLQRSLLFTVQRLPPRGPYTPKMYAVLRSPAVAEAAVGLLLGSCRLWNSPTAAAGQTRQQKRQQRKKGATAASAAGRWWQQQQILELPRAHELLVLTGGHHLVAASAPAVIPAKPVCSVNAPLPAITMAHLACTALNVIYDYAAEVATSPAAEGSPASVALATSRPPTSSGAGIAVLMEALGVLLAEEAAWQQAQKTDQLQSRRLFLGGLLMTIRALCMAASDVSEKVKLEFIAAHGSLLLEVLMQAARCCAAYEEMQATGLSVGTGEPYLQIINLLAELQGKTLILAPHNHVSGKIWDHAARALPRVHQNCLHIVGSSATYHPQCNVQGLLLASSLSAQLGEKPVVIAWRVFPYNN